MSFSQSENQNIHKNISNNKKSKEKIITNLAVASIQMIYFILPIYLTRKQSRSIFE